MPKRAVDGEPSPIYSTTDESISVLNGLGMSADINHLTGA